MFTIINKNRLTFLLLALIIISAGVLRFYKLEQIPPSLSWDEAAVGYNAYSIANWGKDEWGNSFPLVFKSFEDDKHPVHIYITAFWVKLLGSSDFVTRFPAALFGLLNVLMVFFLARTFWKSDVVGLMAAFLLAISPYSLQFSRFNHELNFTVFFFMLGVLLFFKGLERKNRLLIFSSLAFGITLLSYHSAKVVVPPVVLLLIAINIKQLLRIKKVFMAQLTVLALFVALILFNPALLGIARVNQTSISQDEIKKTQWYKDTGNELLGRLQIASSQYMQHLTPKYLFISGDANSRHSTQAAGEFYWADALFLVAGLALLIWSRSKAALVLLAWAVLAPIPAALVAESPHAARAMFMLGSWHLVAAYGFYQIWLFLRSRYLQIGFIALALLAYGWFFRGYIEDYYTNYSFRSANQWQYGMKETVEYIKDRNGYSQVFVTDVRSQPYIFFLYYLKEPLPKFLETVYLNDTKTRSFNLVSFFDKYHFGDWDPIESMPNPGVLYIVSPSQYDGLMHKEVFDVKKRIRYPDGTDAFFLVSYP
ncbi:hypothetical protein A3A14_00915 [Candidatus Daviesbacteria bacterium RIFCSPLOWO2_01_FULL_43_38]|uniref:Glycosyltransferase RgtA/B/C/D-like domain-containing protein n=3 Tax=Candidatus Daviesiibacteriota TaxID=1752718 RepID=A0A1F5K727_9BACT|nr:MAG: hypothetical protein UV33_C0010G0003 [Candidatus Daviesbacteria bacterium GW2011_GWA1_42_6]KKS71227.1 MAG: hypothetical protein UV41_C0003G0012 [Candidatus Daviesbacteria bacterium GW2011_GWA2_42_7]OGE36481.1 MAG: hypothetical protein A3E45_00995 [Candidatus Daviesbacteria bacterium RIFCSPHIGHO2_12_FULL_43_11]OGE63526.1 MAG: hypothetical protein A3A14_00915 [Candidatus Daviesbacteria bacterium RIFCSPLOWO2_01_FULL_43_38]